MSVPTRKIYAAISILSIVISLIAVGFSAYLYSAVAGVAGVPSRVEEMESSVGKLTSEVTGLSSDLKRLSGEVAELRDVVAELAKIPPTPPPPPPPVIPIIPEVPKEEVAAAIIREGATLTASGFSTGGYYSRYLPEAFTKWIKEVYGVDITFKYLPGLGEEILARLKMEKEAGKTPSIDVAQPEDVFAMIAYREGLCEEYVFPHPLIPQEERVPYTSKMGSYAIAFQAEAGVGLAYNPKYVTEEDVGKVKDWTDVAKIASKYEGHIVFWHPVGDPAGIAQVVGVCYAMGWDYRSLDDLKKAMEWIKDNIDPYVLKYTHEMGDFTTLMEKEEAWIVVAWYATIRMFQVKGIMKPIWLAHVPSMPGYAWISKGTEHPTLARLYINWFISHLGQIPPYEEYGIPEDLWIRGMCYGVIPEDREEYLPEWAKEYYPPEWAIKNYIEPDWFFLYWTHATDIIDMWGAIIG